MDEIIEDKPILPIDDEKTSTVYQDQSSIPVLTIEMIKNEPIPITDEKFSIMNEMIEDESIPVEKSSTVEQPINALVLILLIS
jgi:hypothetical protein